MRYAILALAFALAPLSTVEAASPAVAGGARKTSLVSARGGFRGGFHGGFRGGFHGGFHGGFRRIGFHGGFHGGFRRHCHPRVRPCYPSHCYPWWYRSCYPCH